LRSHMGDVEVVLEQVKEVPRGANGKFRAVVCNLPPRQLEALKMRPNGTGAQMVRERAHRRQAEIPHAANISLRNLKREDLDAMATIHMGALPESPITLLGRETIRRYYLWQMIGPHSATAVGAFKAQKLAGICLGGVFRGSCSGFLSLNRNYIGWRLLTHPWLLRSKLLRQHLRQVRTELQLEGIARKHSFHEMHLAIDPTNQRALSFCLGLGWQKTVTEEEWRGDLKKFLGIQ
jgi:hypothetical protein